MRVRVRNIGIEFCAFGIGFSGGLHVGEPAKNRNAASATHFGQVRRDSTIVAHRRTGDLVDGKSGVH
jgi:hypothetical protein